MSNNNTAGAAAKNVASPDNTTGEIVNTAIIGFGMGGSVFHAPIITSLKGFRLSKIYTTNPANVIKARKIYPETEVVDDTVKIYTDKDIKLVAVVTPNLHHYQVAREALNAGKNVVIDKPFTVTTEQADDLISLAAGKGLLLSVFHNRRWDADFRTVSKLVESGQLGKISECEIHYGRYRNYFKNTWKEADLPGSGLLYDIGSHLIDQALCLFGAPAYVYADLRKQREGSRINDNFIIILDYPGTRVVLKAGMLVKEPLPRYIVTGDKGMYVKYGLDIQETDLNAGLTPLTKNNWGSEPKENHGIVNTFAGGLNMRGIVESEPGDYREYYRDIYEVLTQRGTGREPAVTPLQARMVIRVIELAVLSSETKTAIKFG